MTLKELLAAIAAAPVGAVLPVPPGDYGDLALRRRAELTLDLAEGAVFRSIALTQCKPITIKGGEVRFTPNATTITSTSAVRFYLSPGCKLLGVKVTGGPAITGVPEDAAAMDATGNIVGWPTARAVTIDRSPGSDVLDCDISAFHRGVVISNSADVKVARNDIHHLRTSAIVGQDVDRLLISENWLRSSKPWNFGGKGDHGDRIHLWTDPDDQKLPDGSFRPTTGVRIIRNATDQGDGDPILGIYLDDNGNGIGYVDTEIAENTLTEADTQGIRLENVKGRVVDNVLLQSSGTDPRDAPTIGLYAGTEVTIEGNTLADTYGTLKDKYPANAYIPKGVRPAAELEAARLTALRLIGRAPAEPEPVPEPPAPTDPRDAEIATLKASVAELEAILQAAREQIAGLSDDLERAIGNTVTLQTALNAAEAAKAELQVSIDALQASAERLQRRAEDAETKIAAAQAALAA